MLISAEMPQYQCHKKVWAWKIAAYAIDRDGRITITPAEASYGPFTAAQDWTARFKGMTGDLGYYVVYDDGYDSWSPTKAFEDGYSLIK